jgi:fluoride exporter
MLKWLLIAIGGGLGSMLRYAVQCWVGHEVAGHAFPIGTMCVNVIGCFAIGLMSGLAAGPFPFRQEYYFALQVGFLGGFTTFSAFGFETFHLANSRQFGLALINVVVTCTLALTAVWLGHRLGHRGLNV